MWRKALWSQRPPARGNAARSRRTRGRRWPAFFAHDAARTALEDPFRAPFPSVTQRSYRRSSCGVQCTGHTEKSVAHDTYETTESISNHLTIPPSPRELLAMPWVRCRSRASRCSSRCCCWCSPATRGRRWRRRCGRRRGGADTWPAAVGHGPAAGSRRRPAEDFPPVSPCARASSWGRVPFWRAYEGELDLR